MEAREKTVLETSSQEVNVVTTQTSQDAQDMARLGKKQELKVCRWNSPFIHLVLLGLPYAIGAFLYANRSRLLPVSEHVFAHD